MTVIDLELEQKNRQRASRAEAAAAVVTEDATALQFRHRFLGRLLYDHERHCWYAWNGRCWALDTTSHVLEHVRQLAREMSDDQSPASRVRLGKHAYASGVDKFARSDRDFAVDGSIWDRDPFLIGTPAGTLDLRTGALREANAEDHITKLTAVAPTENADCPMWLDFLRQATGGDDDLIRYLQQYCGYCLTASTNEHVMLFIYGSGGNGKTVFANTIGAILADYRTTASMDTFLSARGDRHPTELARLCGARLVTAGETDRDRVFAEARLKVLTGGERISARYMRRDFFEFLPVFKLIMVGNHKPSLSSVDDAIKRRLAMVPFTRRPDRPDKDLEQKLRSEWPAILRWEIDGCLDWRSNGLCIRKSVANTTAAYFEDQDLVSQWLDERCDVDPNNWDLGSDLFASWCAFAKSAGEIPGTTKTFKEILEARGFPYKRRAKGVRGYEGLRLIVRTGNYND
jgi:putative DNA primase/helicase